MIKVKTFTSQLKIFNMMNEIQELDEAVNNFIASNGITKVISTGDAISTGTSGETMGIIRVLTYEQS